MLYTEDFSMHHYVGFSQIGSHMLAGVVLGVVSLISRNQLGLLNWQLCQ